MCLCVCVRALCDFASLCNDEKFLLFRLIARPCCFLLSLSLSLSFLLVLSVLCVAACWELICGCEAAFGTWQPCMASPSIWWSPELTLLIIKLKMARLSASCEQLSALVCVDVSLAQIAAHRQRSLLITHVANVMYHKSFNDRNSACCLCSNSLKIFVFF